MTSTGGWGVPGTGTLAETIEREIMWGGDRSKGMVLEMSANYSADILDAGNTITTDIRAGLIVGKLTTGGELEEWDPDATDGTQDIFGVNPIDFRTLDLNATAVDRVLPVIVRAPFKAASLLIAGSALVGHASEFVARQALVGGGSILDDDPQGYLGGASWRRKILLGASTTLTSADNYTEFFVHSADVDFILPAVQNGLKFRFFMGEDFELEISSATSVFITGHDQTGDGVTWTTDGSQIGCHVEVEGVNIDIAGTNTPSWMCTQLVVPFVDTEEDFFARTINT